MIQEDLADWATNAFKLPGKLARSTVGDILRNAARIGSSAYGDGKRRKPLKVASLRLAKRLIKKYEDQDLCLSRALIKTMTRDLQIELRDTWDLSFSDGWLTRFTRRHGLKSCSLHGEAASASLEIVREGMQRPQELTDLYFPCDIHNTVETGSGYVMTPAHSICSKRKREGGGGGKKNKTRMTVAFIANADGSDVHPILFFGRAEKLLN